MNLRGAELFKFPKEYYEKLDKDIHEKNVEFKGRIDKEELMLDHLLVSYN